MAYDPVRDELVLYAGVDDGGGKGFDDTWVFRDGEWTQRHPATSPERTYGHAMAYDPISERVISFGGYGSRDHTWAWDGTDWTKLHPESSPPPCHSTKLAYDPTRGRLVLFGGARRHTRFGGTWSWDGGTWVNERDLRGLPSPRGGHAMAQVGRRAVLFGGDSFGDLGDTWVLRTNSWVRLFPEESPVARTSSSAVWDPVRREVVLFGGEADSVPLGDTWTLSR